MISVARPATTMARQPTGLAACPLSDRPDECGRKGAKADARRRRGRGRVGRPTRRSAKPVATSGSGWPLLASLGSLGSLGGKRGPPRAPREPWDAKKSRYQPVGARLFFASVFATSRLCVRISLPFETWLGPTSFGRATRMHLTGNPSRCRSPESQTLRTPSVDDRLHSAHADRHSTGRTTPPAAYDGRRLLDRDVGRAGDAAGAFAGRRRPGAVAAGVRRTGGRARHCHHPPARRRPVRPPRQRPPRPAGRSARR